jgi:hypothetical protein
MNAQASAQLSSTAQFSAVCGATSGGANGAASSTTAGTNNGSPNFVGTTGGGTPSGNGTRTNETITPFGTGIQLPGLPSTSTAAGGIALAGLLLCGAGAFLLVRSSRKPF